MVKVADMLPGHSLADSIRRLLSEDLDDIDKSLSVYLFDRSVNQTELLEAWSHLASYERSAYKRLLALGKSHDCH